MKKSSIIMPLLSVLFLSACAQLQGSEHSEAVYRSYYGDKLSKRKYKGTQQVKTQRVKHGTIVQQAYSRGRLRYAGNWGQPLYLKNEDTPRQTPNSSVVKEGGINKPLFIKNLRTILSSASEMMDEFDRVEQREARESSIPK